MAFSSSLSRRAMALPRGMAGLMTREIGSTLGCTVTSTTLNVSFMTIPPVEREWVNRTCQAPSVFERLSLGAGILGPPIPAILHDLLALLESTQGIASFDLGNLDNERLAHGFVFPSDFLAAVYMNG